MFDYVTNWMFLIFMLMIIIRRWNEVHHYGPSVKSFRDKICLKIWYVGFKKLKTYFIFGMLGMFFL